MSWSLYKETHPVARKEYACEAWPHIDNFADFDDFTAEELEVIEKARAEKFKILPGTRYVKVTGIFDGEFSTFRAREDLNEICLENGLYPED